MLFSAHSLKDPKLLQYCENQLLQMIARIHDHDTPLGLPFCYGKAGIVAILSNAGFLLEHPQFHQEARKIAENIISQYDPASAFGFKCIAPTNQEDEILLIDNPGLLTGSIGILLSLLMVIAEEKPSWNAIFLLN